MDCIIFEPWKMLSKDLKEKDITIQVHNDSDGIQENTTGVSNRIKLNNEGELLIKLDNKLITYAKTVFCCMITNFITK